MNLPQSYLQLRLPGEEEICGLFVISYVVVGLEGAGVVKIFQE